jgi:hypothetical protein
MKYDQLAAQNPEDLARRLDGDISIRLIYKQRWIEQAQTLIDENSSKPA